MTENLGLSAYTYEREFWKRYRTLRHMVAHLKTEDILVHKVGAESVIPEQARDMAVKAMLDELSANQKVFLEFFYDFIGFCSQGLHRADILVRFTSLPGGLSEIEDCYLIIDGRKDEMPVEIGRRFIDIIPHAEGWKEVLAFYRNEETKFDRVLGGSLDRCSLKILEELYPTPCHHIQIRLPVQVMADYNPF